MFSLSLLDLVIFISRRKGCQKNDNSEHLPGFFRCILNRAVEEYSADNCTNFGYTL